MWDFSVLKTHSKSWKTSFSEHHVHLFVLKKERWRKKETKPKSGVDLLIRLKRLELNILTVDMIDKF